MRMVSVRQDTANDEAKSVEVVIASENPVERWDDERGTVVNEVLAMDGVRFRTQHRQLPIVDSHNRSTVRNVLGSVRNIRVDNGQLVGDAVFARDEASQEAYQKVKDGHLTDFSVTANMRRVKFVPRGEVMRMNDREVQGPADIVMEWIPTDASLVAAGADETSTVRQLMRSYTDVKQFIERKRMNEELTAALIAKGMPEQITDFEQALAWAVGVIGTNGASTPTPEVVENMDEEEVVENMEATDEEKVVENMDEELIENAVGRALKNERKRQKEIYAICERAGIERAIADKLVDSNVSLDIAREKVLEHMIQKPVGSGASRIEVVTSGDESFSKAIGAGLVQRAFQGAGVRKQPEAAPGANDFKGMSLLRMAEKWLQRHGANTDRMSNENIARASMSSSYGSRFGIQRDAYHTTGSFPALMLDATNKTLQAAYEEAPYTWNIWARQGTSTNDLKNINRVRFSESPDLEAIPERGPYKEKAMSDQKETYAPIKYGAMFSVSWETVINDDLDAISRVPAMHGNAARRKQNKVVYSVLTANDLMSDGVALFGSHASGTNLDGSAAAISVPSLNLAYTAMMTQKGLTSDAIAGVIPRFLIVPAAISATAEELISSRSYIVANGNEGVQNLYGQGGSRPMTVVVEPVLDANSATAWYLAADPSRGIDTVELTFLSGEETPQLDSEWEFNNDTWKYKVRQTFGVKAIDWRGLYKNPGA